MDTSFFKLSSIKRLVTGYFLGIMIIVGGTVITITLVISYGKLIEGQKNKARIVSSNMALTCGDLMMVGEWDRIMEILGGIKKSDIEMQYAIVIGSDGRCVASTESELKDTFLNKTEFEKKTIEVKENSYFFHPDIKDIFEMAVPVYSAGERIGTLRMGYGTKYIKTMIMKTVLNASIITIFALLVGSILNYLIIQKIIIIPLSKIMELSKRITEGDLSHEILDMHGIKYEMRDLAYSFMGLQQSLIKVAMQANIVAAGDLSQTIELKGDLAEGFNKMTKSLRSMTKQLQEGILNISSFSNEIMSSAEEQSAGATEQATALSEISATIEGLSNTAGQIAE
ncbi:methyl-accepting chemotaxis protein, partial [Candidatus Desantisbacteria bacterium]|nr:methyl-accepting chemotaxis protein [Candidatus Desantisbacteria bacterium]